MRRRFMNRGRGPKITPGAPIQPGRQMLALALAVALALLPALGDRHKEVESANLNGRPRGWTAAIEESDQDALTGWGTAPIVLEKID